jgi:hypothetical protein
MNQYLRQDFLLAAEAEARATEKDAADALAVFYHYLPPPALS